MSASRPKALFVLEARHYPSIYPAALRERIAERVDVLSPEPLSRERCAEKPSALAEAELLFSGWGAPVMDAAFLAAAPRLRMVFYGAGSIRYFVTDALWDRGVRVCSAWAANAIPVSEYTLSQIVFCLKQGYRLAREVRENRSFVPSGDVAGMYGSTVGLVSLGMIGSRVCGLLKHFDVKVIAYDPFVAPERARELGVETCALEEVFRRADVVSLHTPWLPETENMIRGAHFRSMKKGAAFINTARGAVVNEAEMIAALAERPDLQAVLDVTHPEPPATDSPLYTLPNVVLTPHVAGSICGEVARQGLYMLEELDRSLRGEKLLWEVTREMAARMA
jgi:phosphoglycerate dehydrogenase-like enzyme